MAYKPLKLWFDKEVVKLLADKMKSYSSDYNYSTFTKKIDAQLADLELKDRVEVIADRVYEAVGKSLFLDREFLLAVLGPENEEETGMFKEYYWVMPVAKYVEKYGLDDYDASMCAIEEITKRNTGEYTIRPYLEQYTNKTLAQMKRWSKNKNKHVRRLSSEGVRPRLPWAKKLDIFIQDPTPIIPILDNLKDDHSKYVQKSVANCINDILKDNPDIGKEIIDNWNQPKISKPRQWIIKHALRNLIKKEDKWARQVIDD